MNIHTLTQLKNKVSVIKALDDPVVQALIKAGKLSWNVITDNQNLITAVMVVGATVG